MIIDASNGSIINSKAICIHDDIVDELHFWRSSKKLHLSVKKENGNDYSIDYLEVIGFEITSCDFWGSSPHILDFEYVEKLENTIIPALFMKNNTSSTLFCSLDNQDAYFESKITFSSGDCLKVACKSINID